MKRVNYWIIGIVVILIIGLSYVICQKRIDTDSGKTLIGGQRDSHGCLGPAGYTWNETEKACVREWVSADSEEERYQVTNFQQCVDAGNPVMESYPRQCRAPRGDVFTEEINK